jgi:hypothetical protein
MKDKKIPFNMTLAERICDKSVCGKVYVNTCKDNVCVGRVKSIYTDRGVSTLFVYSKDLAQYIGTFICVSDGKFTLNNGDKAYLITEITTEEPEDNPGSPSSVWTVDKTREVLQTLIRHGVWSKRCFESICCELIALHEKKNKDYGGAFDKSMFKFGVTALMIRLNDKWERLESLFKNGKAEIADESFEDTLKDIACYAIMGLENLYNK